MDDLHILFCYEGTVTPGTVFQSNHFVPLLFHTQQPKRKYVAASSQASAKRQKLCPYLSKKASNITKFFNVAEKPVLKPKSQDNSKLDLDKPSTSTNTKTKTSVLKSDETPIAKKVKLCPTNFDVAMYRDMVKGMSSSEICNLIKNVFRPDKKYPFPKTNGRSFRYDWLELYSWLCYSPSQDGALCLSCVLFGDRFPGKSSKIHNLFF